MPTLTPHKTLELISMAMQPDSGLSIADRARLFERIVGAVSQVLLVRQVTTRMTTPAERQTLGEAQDLAVTVEVVKGRMDLDILTRHYLSVVTMLPKPAPRMIPNLSIGEWVIGKTSTQDLVGEISFRRRPGFDGEDMPEVRWTTDLGQAHRWTIYSEAEAARAMLWDAGMAVDLFTAADFAPKAKTLETPNS